MKCPRCNAALPEAAKFCGVCGQKVEEMASGSASPSSVPAAGGGVARDGLVGASIRDGWKAFKSQPGLLIGLFILLMFVLGLASAVLRALFGEDTFSVQMGDNLWSLIQNIFLAGYFLAALKVLRGRPAAFQDLFAGFNQAIPILVGGLLAVIGVVLGLVLLVIPGLILALGLSQWMFLIIDRGAPFMDALKGSWAMMRGYKWTYLGFCFTLLGLNILGLLALVLGLLVTIPTSLAAMAAFYNRLLVLNPPPEFPRS